MSRIPASLAMILGLAALSLTSPSDATAQAQAGSLSVAEAVVTTGVEERQPVDEVSTVSADVGRVFLWTRVTGAQGEVDVAHVWYHGDQEIARVPLRVASPNWRTWTSKEILPHWTGSWRVEVEGPGGQVLHTASFQVQGGGR
ncbi:MAG: DUF2914 domain-containing protein [Gemmatimonadetes bacterium]|nr:DUF2914 domain-containing protein [Gemmatimonadota bacterium]NIR79991.1 DUF2914 domain-containing protein [Gemmatimonadota bacterium]NIT88722.1 DUF2914 domain-containing protein [Gemmatimonadota bacterium]NIU32529.1 DUF2914 domain-containing protein [Gemmatimonadota bacterium]NIU36999.1 DUF2914 domain-containing protein [Gemmatimonadota bacterium]